MSKKHQPTQQALLEGFTLSPFVDMDAVERAFSAPVLAVDVETETRWSGVGPEQDFGLSYASDVRVIGLAWEKGYTVVVGPFTDEFCAALKARFEGQNTIIAHNAVFDMRGLSRLTGGIVPASIWDTQTMARLLHPEKSEALGYGLLAVALALGLPFSTDQATLKGKRNALHELDPELVKQYAMDDAALALRIYQAQIALVTNEQVYLLADWECRAVQTYCQMAATGVRLNVPHVQGRINELREVVAAALDQLKADGLDNPNSPKARARYIYETKHIPIPDYAPGSGFFTAGAHKRAADDPEGYEPTIDDMSTGADVMRYLVGVADEIDIDVSEDGDQEQGKYTAQLQALADYLSASKMLATLISLLDHSAIDGRLHSLVSISTHAGRRSASHPQVQNWRMVAQDVAGDMSGVVLGDSDDSTLVEIDYSNAENWIAALLSGDDALARACASQDFHSAMAAQYFGTTWELADADRRKALRKMGKSVTFGTAYGMGPGKLAQRLGVSKDEAIAILAAKDRAFPYVRDAKEAVERKVARAGSVNLWTGRQVMVALNQAYRGWNYCAQGGVSELVKRAIVLISEEYARLDMQSRVALDMHDAVIISVKHSEWQRALSIASSIMAGVMPDELNARTDPAVRWIAEPDISENEHKWGRFQLCFPYIPEKPVASVSFAGARLADEEFERDKWWANFPALYRQMTYLYQTFRPVLEANPTGVQTSELEAVHQLGTDLLAAMAATMKFCEAKGVWK